MVRRRVIVSGEVQGVGFRATGRRAARAAGVAGWVRNLSDGRVEAVFEGDQVAVDAMVAWCRRGPSWATVSGVSVEEQPPAGEHGFASR